MKLNKGCAAQRQSKDAFANELVLGKAVSLLSSLMGWGRLSCPHPAVPFTVTSRDSEFSTSKPESLGSPLT